jgi:hypothetical protein
MINTERGNGSAAAEIEGAKVTISQMNIRLRDRIRAILACFGWAAYGHALADR